LKKKIIHLVTGFGIYKYFINAINSIILNDKHSDILVISTGDLLSHNKKINPIISEVKSYVNNLNIKNKIFYFSHHNLQNIKNVKKIKTGLLYSSYNFALEFSKNKYKYINILQNDMQLLFWNKKIINLIDQLFSINDKIIQISGAFPKKGSQCNFYEIDKSLIENYYIPSLKKNKNILLFANYGILDTGVIHLERALNNKLIWKIDETYMSQNFKKKGFKVLHSPIPFTSFLPWPSCAVRGAIIPPPTIINSKQNDLLLKNTKKDMFNKLNNYNRELWQEEWVKPYKWYSLEPSIYTFLKFREYIKDLINYKKKFKKLEFKYVSYKDTKNFFLNFNFFSSNIKLRPRIFTYLYYYLLIKFNRKINKILN
jgi:hypothetical protein